MRLFSRAARAPAPERAEPTLPDDPGRAAQVSAARNFQMARNSRLTQSWSRRLSTADANQLVYADHATLTARAREQSINNGYAKRFYRLLKQNVIGPFGIGLMSKAVDAAGEPDRKTRKKIEAEYWDWCERGNCDVTRSYSFTTFQNLWVETLARDGEVLVRIVKGFGNKHRFAVQILEADRLDVNLNELLSNGNRIRMGVERDEWEAPVAYWLLRDHPGDVFRGPPEEKYQRIPVDELRHTFDPWRPHQSRGFTWTHASALELHHLGEYRNSEMVAAEQGAKITGVYEQNAEFLEPPADDEADAEIEEVVEAGTNKLLPYGVTWKAFNNNHPSTNFAPFTKAGLRGIAAGLGPGYNKLAQDLEGVNFSALRAGELDERDFYKVTQQFAISELMNFVGRAWLEMALLSGRLNLPPSNFDLYKGIEWAPRGWDWVDPSKDAKSATESIGNRTKTRSEYIRQSGRDPDEVFTEMAREEEHLRSLNLLGAAAPAPNTEEK